MKLELMPFQRETVDYGKSHPYSIYALEMGLGKSICALQTAHETNSKALIICPAYLKLRWKAEVDKFYHDKVVSIFHKKEEFYFPFDSDVVIIAYSFLEHAAILFEWADIVVCDEANFLKEMKAKRTEAFHRLVYEHSIKRCLLLTGTPILNRVYEFYSLIAICNYDPRIKESVFLSRFPTYVDFANHFSYLTEREIYRGNRRVKVQQWEGYRNVEELKFYLKDCYIRFRSRDILDLPDYTDIFVPVESQDFPELLSEFELFVVGNTSVQSDVKAKAALAKAPLTVEYVKSLLEQDLQVVIYTDHVGAAEYIAEKLRVTAITGATPMKQRQHLADEFQAGRVQKLVATIGSFSTGVDLQNAQNMVFNDPTWVPGQMEQAKFRILRIGQKSRCNFHYMIGSAQDEVIYKKLAIKSDTIKGVIG